MILNREEHGHIIQCSITVATYISICLLHNIWYAWNQILEICHKAYGMMVIGSFFWTRYFKCHLMSDEI